MHTLRHDSTPEEAFDALVEATDNGWPAKDKAKGVIDNLRVEHRYIGLMPKTGGTIEDYTNADIDIWMLTWTRHSFSRGDITEGRTIIDAGYSGLDEAMVVRYVMPLPRDERELEAMALLASRDHLRPHGCIQEEY